MSRSIVFPLLLLGALGACNSDDGGHKACEEADKVEVFVDNDEDGFGGESAGRVCKPAAQQALVDGDCDDGDPHLSPDADEVCDDVDNDCDGRVDEGLPTEMYFPDADGDGYGYDEIDPVMACAPKPGWVTDLTDCDDEDANVNPAARELCNGGIDDDCDHYADTEDLNIDPTEFTAWYPDEDEDGWGDDADSVMACEPPLPGWVATPGDCDDAPGSGPGINPLAIEICDRIDNDCDGLTDDLDDSIDPATQQQFFADADGDGYGDAATLTLACEEIPGIGVTNSDDCDDTDPLAYVDQWWRVDTDGDGAGDGPQLVFQCLNPGAGMGPEGSGIDCEPNNPHVFPLQVEDCFDGIDQNCNTDVDCSDPDCSGVQGCDYIQDFESGAIPPEFTSGGSSTFAAIAGAAQEGTYRAVSGNISDNQEVWMEIQLNYAVAGSISFYHTGSTETNYDWFRFMVDGVQVFSQSGSWGWTYSEFNVTPGPHTFRWRYTKDISVSSGSDDIGIDYIYATGGTL